MSQPSCLLNNRYTNFKKISSYAQLPGSQSIRRGFVLNRLPSQAKARWKVIRNQENKAQLPLHIWEVKLSQWDQIAREIIASQYHTVSLGFLRRGPSLPCYGVCRERRFPAVDDAEKQEEKTLLWGRVLHICKGNGQWNQWTASHQYPASWCQGC